MAGKVEAKFSNISGKTLSVAIFEVTKDENGKQTGKAMFVGAVASNTIRMIEIDNTFMPWACIPQKAYKIGDSIDDVDRENLIELRNYGAGGAYELSYWNK